MVWRAALSASLIFSALSLLLSALLWTGQIGPPTAGEKARERQCAIYPVSLKLYSAAAKYDLISERDLETYQTSRPSGCS